MVNAYSTNGVIYSLDVKALPTPWKWYNFRTCDREKVTIDKISQKVSAEIVSRNASAKKRELYPSV